MTGEAPDPGREAAPEAGPGRSARSGPWQVVLGLASARVVRNVVFNYLGFLLQGVIAVLLTPFLVHRLGDTAFGVWILLNSLLVYFQLGELGIMSAIIRYVSLHEAQGDRRSVEGVVGSALAFLLGLALLTVPATWLLARLGPGLFDLAGEEALFFARATWLTGATAVVCYFRRLFYGVLKGYQRFGVLNICAVSATLWSTPLTVLLVLRGYGLLALVVVALLRAIYELVFEVVALKRATGLSLSPRLGSRADARRLAGYSLWAFVIDAAVSISYRIDAIIIGIFLPVAAITPFTIATRLSGFLEETIDPMVDTFFPLASELHAASRADALRRLLVMGTRAALVLASPGIVLLAWHGADLIGWWMGEAYVAPSLNVLRVSLGVVLVAVLGATGGRLLLGIGQVRLAAFLSVTRATAKVLLCIILIDRYGIIGAVWATLLPSAALSLLVALPWICRITGLGFGRFLIEVSGHAATIAGVSLAFLWLVGKLGLSPVVAFAVDTIFVAGVSGLVAYRLARAHR